MYYREYPSQFDYFHNEEGWSGERCGHRGAALNLSE